MVVLFNISDDEETTPKSTVGSSSIISGTFKRKPSQAESNGESDLSGDDMVSSQKSSLQQRKQSKGNNTNKTIQKRDCVICFISSNVLPSVSK